MHSDFCPTISLSISYISDQGSRPGTLEKLRLQSLELLGRRFCPSCQASWPSELITRIVRLLLHLTILFRVKVFLLAQFLLFVKEKKRRNNAGQIPYSRFVGSRRSQAHTWFICLKPAPVAQRQRPLPPVDQGHLGSWGLGFLPPRGQESHIFFQREYVGQGKGHPARMNLESWQCSCYHTGACFQGEKS